MKKIIHRKLKIGKDFKKNNLTIASIILYFKEKEICHFKFQKLIRIVKSKK